MTAGRAGRGPRWTHRRLRLVVGVAFGMNARGQPHTAAAAAALGVSQRTVQRWLHGTDRTLARLPAGRLEQIQAAARPDPETLRQEEIAARYAHEAIAQIAAPGGAGVLAAWRQQKWLEPHLVAVLELWGLGLRQVAITRASDRALPELHKRGKVLSHTTLASRFHATALVAALLTQLDPWRVMTPPGVVKQGRTQTWVADAPAVILHDLAVTHRLR